MSNKKNAERRLRAKVNTKATLRPAAEKQLADAKADIKAILPKLSTLSPRSFSQKNEITIASRKFWVYAQSLPYVMWGHDNTLPQQILEYCASDNVIRPLTGALQRILEGDEIKYTTPQAKLFLEALGIRNILPMIAWDLILLDGFAVLVNTPNDITKGITHVRFADIRVDKRNTYTNQVGYYYAKDWGGINLLGQLIPQLAGHEEYEVKVMLPYGNEKSEELYYKSIYHPSGNYYPTPSTQTVESLVQISTEAIRFHVSYLKNGVVGSIIMNIPININETDPEAMQKKIDELKDLAQTEWQSTVNAGKPFINIVPISPLGDDNVPPTATLSGFPQDANDKRHLDLVRFVREEKFIGMGVPVPEAFGMPSQGASILGQAEVMDWLIGLRNTL
jgi:hypothetical protein